MTDDQILALVTQLITALHQSTPATPAPAQQTVLQPQPAPSIDPFVNAGTPNTTYLDVTKHVLSNPQLPVEGLPSYAWRVSDQAHAGGDKGAQAQIDARNGIGLGYGIQLPFLNAQGVVVGMPIAADGSNWPVAVDFYFNRQAYLLAWAPNQAAQEAQAAVAQQQAMALSLGRQATGQPIVTRGGIG